MGLLSFINLFFSVAVAIFFHSAFELCQIKMIICPRHTMTWNHYYEHHFLTDIYLTFPWTIWSFQFSWLKLIPASCTHTRCSATAFQSGLQLKPIDPINIQAFGDASAVQASEKHSFTHAQDMQAQQMKAGPLVAQHVFFGWEVNQ